jgi:hypothetical protein
MQTGRKNAAAAKGQGDVCATGTAYEKGAGVRLQRHTKKRAPCLKQGRAFAVADAV